MNHFDCVLRGTSFGNPIWDGLTHYWRMDETSGSNVYDSVGSYTGTFANGAMDANGKNNYCYYNSSKPNYNISIGNTFNPSITESFSINFWVKHSAINYWQSYISNANDGLAKGFYLFQNNSNIIYWSLKGDSSHEIAATSTNGTNSIDTWYMMTFTYAGTRLLSGCKFYRSTSLLTNSGTKDTFSTGDMTTTEVTRLAGYFQNNYPLTGRMDEMGIWNRVLSQTEINTLYNSGSGIFY